MIISGVVGMKGFLKPLVTELTRNGIEVEVFDVESWTVRDELLTIKSKAPRININVRGLRRMGRKLSFRLLPGVVKKYDSLLLLGLQQWMVTEGKTLNKLAAKIALYYVGSDLFRVESEQVKKHRKLYKFCDLIAYAQDGMKEYIKSNVSSVEDSRLRRVRFGIPNLSLIEKLKPHRNAIRQRWGIDQNEIVVTIGYNASKFQQHIKIIEHTPCLKQENLLLIFPMTYPRDPEYLDEIDQMCKQEGLNARILRDYLSSEQISELRILEDFVINMQTTDASSASLLESAYAGSQLLIGKWLAYSFYNQVGAYYEKVGFEDLNDKLEGLIDQFSNEKDYEKALNPALKEDYCWESRVTDWVELIK